MDIQSFFIILDCVSAQTLVNRIETDLRPPRGWEPSTERVLLLKPHPIDNFCAIGIRTGAAPPAGIPSHYVDGLTRYTYNDLVQRGWYDE